MLLVLKNQKAQPLECEIFSEVCMSYGVLLVRLYYLLAIVQLVGRGRLDDELHFVFHSGE